MKFLFLILFSFSLLFSCEQDDISCLKKEAFKYKNDPKTEEKAAEMFLDLSLKGDAESTRELAMLYIYGKSIKRDCKKGIYILLNSLDKKNSFPAGYKDLYNLFHNGICVKKDEKIANKYNDTYIRKMKEAMR